MYILSNSQQIILKYVTVKRSFSVLSRGRGCYRIDLRKHPFPSVVILWSVPYVCNVARMKIFLSSIIHLRADYSLSSSCIALISLTVDITHEIYSTNEVLKLLHEYTGEKFR
jgi:hypothetical protein